MVSVRDGGDREALVRAHITSFASLGVLRLLRAEGPRVLADLEAHIGSTAAETTCALSDLAAAGLVERIDDGRASRFALTAHSALRAAIEALLDRYEQESFYRTRLVLEILRRMSAEAPSA